MICKTDVKKGSCRFLFLAPNVTAVLNDDLRESSAALPEGRDLGGLGGGLHQNQFDFGELHPHFGKALGWIG